MEERKDEGTWPSGLGGSAESCLIWKGSGSGDIGAGFGRKRGAKVSFSGGAGYGDDHFPFVFRPGGNLDGGPNIGAGADSGENSFFFGKSAGHHEGIVAGDLDALCDLEVF